MKCLLITRNNKSPSMQFSTWTRAINVQYTLTRPSPQQYRKKKYHSRLYISKENINKYTIYIHTSMVKEESKKAERINSERKTTIAWWRYWGHEILGKQRKALWIGGSIQRVNLKHIDNDKKIRTRKLIMIGQNKYGYL